MEVTVIQLRHQGQKLSREQPQQATRVHGYIALNYWILNNGREPPRRIKELILKPAEDAHCSPLLTLTDPVQTKLKRLDMIYTGIERIDGEAFPQAWWVKAQTRD